MAGLEEYDLEIKLVHTIKVHGLCQMAMEAVYVREEEDPSRWSKKLRGMISSEPPPLSK